MARILVVDDDQAILSIVQAWLENAGHAVSQALDGDIALNFLHETDFDVLITDIIMPNTEGIELIRQIRQTHKDLSIVAISGGGANGANYLTAAEKLGADTVISKPLDQHQIVDAVATLLH